MRTSYSALDTYRVCPLKYKYSQIDKLKEPKRVESVFGTLIHSALKYMFERDPLYPTLDEVIDFFSKKWTEKSEAIEWRNKSKKDTEEKMYFEEGLKILKNFYKKNQPWNFNAVELEGRFSVELLDELTGKRHTLAGIIDRIDKDPESGVYEIIDYKTGKSMPSEEALKGNLQLGLYHLAISSRWPSLADGSIKTSLYFLKHNEKVSIIPERNNIAEVKKSILEAIREIEEHTEKGGFPPTPSALCNWCGFRKICPMWSHEYLKEEERAPEDQEMSEIINEFFEIKNSEDENKKKIAELRLKILLYMDTKHLARVFGGDGHITKNEQVRYSYDMEKIRPVLEKTGLWEKVLIPDSKELEKLLSGLPENIQEEILKKREKKTVITLKQSKAKR